MTKRTAYVTGLFLAAAAQLAAQAPAWYQTDFPPEEFKARWAKIYDKIGDKSVVAMQGVAMTRGYNMPRQTNRLHRCGSGSTKRSLR